MKKILFSCLLALGIGVSAQYDITQDFETDLTGFSHFGGGTLSTTQFCNGAGAGALTFTSAISQTGWMGDLLELGDLYGQTDNGQKVNVSFNYKKGSGLTGTLYVMYALYNEATDQWSVTTIGNGVAVTAGATTTCSSLTGVIPAGTFAPGKTYGVGAWFIRSGNTTGSVYIDDIVIKQDVATTVPSCAAFTAPTAGSTVSGGTFAFKWPEVATASAYKITIGKTAGASDVLNTTVQGNQTSLNVALATNTTYYAKIVPTNSIGDAVGCTEISFNTNAQIGYCGPIISTQPSATYPISSVTMSGVTKTSSATVGSVAYEDFTATKFNVTAGTAYPLNVVGTGLGTNRFGMTVFIDWNNDGDFTDAGEQYFTAPANFVGAANGATNNLTGSIAVPSAIGNGEKRMRIKYNFSSSTTQLHDALVDGCSNVLNGQVEDYTLVVTGGLAVSDVNKTNVSIYPNPFKNVLKISDVKDVKSINVSDASGRMVSSPKVSQELDLSSLKKGVYFVTVSYENGTSKTFKAIKE